MNDSNPRPSPDPVFSPPRLGLPWRVLVWALIFWSMILTLWLYVYSVRHGGLPCWDEYERCAWAAHIWYDLRHFDSMHFWKHTNAQVVWPFLHSWITGALFVLFEPSLASARLLSLGAHLGIALMILAWFARRGGPWTWAGAVTAWALYTTSPIVVQHAVSMMSEIFGLFLVLAALVTIPSNPNAKWTRWLLPGTLLALIFFYKYNYAFLTVAGLLVNRYALGGYELRGMATRSNLTLFGVPAVLVGLWFIPEFSNKWENLIYFAVNNPAAYMPWGLSSLFYYPQVIPKAYFTVPWMAVAALALVFIGAPLTGRLSLRDPMMAVFLVHFLAAVYHPFKMERFQFIPMGLFFLLTGEAVRALFYQAYLRFPKGANIINGTMIVALVLACVPFQSRFYRQAQVNQQNVYETPIRAVIDRFQSSDRIAFFITHDLASPPAATFYMISSLDRLQRDWHKAVTYWNHLFLFRPGESVRELSMEEQFKILRHELYVTQSNKIVMLESTAPWEIVNFEAVFGGVHEFCKLVPFLEEYKLEYERFFPQARARLRIFVPAK